MRHAPGHARMRQPRRLSLPRRLLSLLLFALAASCTEGGAPMAPGEPGMLRLLLQPSMASMNTCAAAAPINRIRLTALAEPGGAVVHREVFEVLPTDPSWTLRLDVPLDGTVARVVVLMELINVSGAGVESVQCSGMTAPVDLGAGGEQQAASVVIYDGPADNLRATGVDITTDVPATLAEGESIQLQVQVTGPGSPRASWSSLDPEIASVSETGLVQLLRDGTARIVASAGVLSDVVTITSTQRATSLRITEASQTAASLGQEIVFSAAVLDPRGAPIPGAVAQWTIDNGAVAQSLGGGVFRAAANGTATVRATAAGNPAATATAMLVVRQQPVTVTVTPASFIFSSIGAGTTYAAQARDARGNVIGDATFTWSSSAPGTVSVTPAGAATAVAAGTASIIARAGTVEGSATAQVTPVPVRLVVDPGSMLLEALGASADATARALDASGAAIPGTAISWSSSNAAVATVDGNGRVRAVSNGSATITAAHAGLTASLQVTVRQRGARIALTPAARTAASFGEVVEFDASLVDEGGAVVAGDVVWSSSDEDVAVSLGNGAFRASGNGTATVRATSSSDPAVRAEGTLEVRQQAARVVVSPASFLFTAVGLTTEFTAAAFDALGAEIVDAPLAWSSDGAAVAIDSDGVATAMAAGTTNIRATAPNGVSGTALATVRQVVASLELSPATLHFTQVGASAPVTVTARDAGGNVVLAPEGIAWTSSSPAATVNGAGVVTAAANGTAVITASAGPATAQVTAVVEQAAASIDIVPSALTLTHVGATGSLTATVRDAGGSAIPGLLPAWSTADPAIATVDNGVVTAVSPGSTTITAVSGTFATAATVTVQQVPSSIRIDGPVTFDAIGRTVPLSARVVDAGGVAVPGSPITWSSSNPSIVEVSGSTATARAAGTATLTATAGALTAEIAAAVQQVPFRMEVEPEAIVLQPGQQLLLQVRVFDELGAPVPSDVVTFSSADAAVAVASAEGMVTAIGTGSTIVEVRAGDVIRNLDVTVGSGATGGTISGRVTHAVENTPIAGATVSFNPGTVGNGFRTRSLRGAASPPATTTDADGRYTSPLLPPGTWTVTVTADGFIGTSLHDVEVTSGPVEVQSVPLVPFSTLPGGITGRINNAQTAQNLEGVTVELRSGVGATTGLPLAVTTTNSNGFYSFDELAAGTYSVLAHTEGYVPGSRTGISVGGSTVANQNISLVAEAVTEGEVRIILSWGANPRDLDSHLTGPLSGGGRFHVYFGDEGSLTSSPFASLDVDDTSGHGPETITIAQQFPGTYSYSVHHWSGSETISTSGAVVRVFRGNTLIALFEPPSGGTGDDDVWHVFDLSGNTVTPVNVFTPNQQIPGGMSTLSDGFRRTKQR